ncbi:MAG: cytochrome c oxidase subunit 3 [Bacteriovorax sp.]|nr:cytochrome c oxidase subunit 3 [Bacteriovorax sp.]
MSELTESEDNIFAPPGGILVWIIMAIEFFTFLMGIFYFYAEKTKNLNLFHEMQKSMSLKIAIINTVVLVTSGFFVANAVSFYKSKNRIKTLECLGISIFLGALFLLLKGFEYYQKIELGHTMDSNIFYNLYWFLTLFHYFHVVVGVGLLCYFTIQIKKKTQSWEFLGPLEAGATLWHMCDLIWILIFPTLYLLR